MHRYLEEHVGAFGPHEIRTLVASLDKAWESIQASGAKFDTAAQAESARAILATHMIEAAKQGEHDQGRLRDGALVAWAQLNLRSWRLDHGNGRAAPTGGDDLPSNSNEDTNGVKQVGCSAASGDTSMRSNNRLFF